MGIDFDMFLCYNVVIVPFVKNKQQQREKKGENKR